MLKRIKKKVDENVLLVIVTAVIFWIFVFGCIIIGAINKTNGL
jgi:hypothetical protein